jgi:hypothetical protein
MEILLMMSLVFSLILNIFLGIISFRFSRRLLQFDDLFERLVDDVDVNIRYFEKLLTTPLFENNEEVRVANKNMGIISMRLEEFVTRMEELTNRKLRRKPEVSPNPPVVI